MRLRAFTLVEVLIVTAIIGVLFATTVPVLVATRKAALEAACASNMRNVWLALELYGGDRGGWAKAPRSLAPVGDLVGDKRVFACPSDPRHLTRWPMQVYPREPHEATVSYQISYHYVRHFLPDDSVPAWVRFIAYYPQATVLLCMWHGERRSPWPGHRKMDIFGVGRFAHMRMDGSYFTSNRWYEDPNALFGIGLFLIDGGRDE